MSSDKPDKSKADQLTITDVIPARWSEEMVTANDLRQHYYRTGSGAEKPTLLLLHGFSESGQCWSRVARTLEDRVRSHLARRARTWPLGPARDGLLTGNAHARRHRLHRRAESGATLPLGLLKRRQNGGGGRRKRAREYPRRHPGRSTMARRVRPTRSVQRQRDEWRAVARL